MPLSNESKGIKIILQIIFATVVSNQVCNTNILYSVTGMIIWVFSNGPGDLGSIPGRVIPKTQKCYLMFPCLTLIIIRYVSRVKLTNPGKGVAPYPTLWCSRYQKKKLRVPLDLGRQLYFYIFKLLFRLNNNYSSKFLRWSLIIDITKNI